MNDKRRVKRVLLDRGHGPHNGKGGAYDPGAPGLFTTEHRVVSKIVQGMDQAFTNSGLQVVLTPEASISDVVQWANSIYRPGDYLIALHLNSSTSKTASGVEVIYHYNAPPARRGEAEQMSAFLASYLGLQDRGVKADSETPAGKPKANGQAGLPMLRDSKAPAFILELGFITNKTDLQRVERKGGMAVAEMLRMMKGWKV